MTTSGPVATLLEMAAVNNGFDHEHASVDGWLAFSSTQVPLRIWLRQDGDADYLVALSQANVARSLREFGERITIPTPVGAVARLVPTIPALHQLLRRAFQLSRTLPDELLRAFERATEALPRTTEAERLVVVRVGQDIFRSGLIDYWEGRCAVTGLELAELLKASHIKPWSACELDAERLDVFNGVLLAPNLDAVFDRGLISFADDGRILISDVLHEAHRAALGVGDFMRLPVAEGHHHYLGWHRANLFATRARSG